MAFCEWLGNAPAIAQLDTFTIGGSPTAGDTVTIAIGTIPVTYTVTAADAAASSPVDSVAANFVALLSLGTIPQFAEEQWAAVGTGGLFTATAATPGVPVTWSTSDTGSTTLGGSNTVASSGPNDASVVLNWSTGALPIATNDVIIAVPVPIKWGLAALAPAIALNSFQVLASFNQQLGLPYQNTNGYVEYRQRFFPIKTTVPITIGEGTGTGPTMCNIANGAVLALTIFTTSARSSPSIPVVNVIGCTSGVFAITAGDLAIAGDDASTTGTVTTGSIAGSGATVTVGPGATVTTLNNNNGAVNAYGAVTTLNNNGGTVYLYGTPTTITANPGSVANVVYWLGTGTITTATFNGQGPGQYAPQLNRSPTTKAGTITNATFVGGSSFWDPNATVTRTNPFQFDYQSMLVSNFGPRPSF